MGLETDDDLGLGYAAYAVTGGAQTWGSQRQYSEFPLTDGS